MLLVTDANGSLVDVEQSLKPGHLPCRELHTGKGTRGPHSSHRTIVAISGFMLVVENDLLEVSFTEGGGEGRVRVGEGVRVSLQGVGRRSPLLCATNKTQ